MKMALLGYGKMGRMVEQAAAKSSHEVVCVIDPFAGSRGKITDADVCVDFSQPDAVISNIALAAGEGRPIVIGTTGWYERVDEAKKLVEQAGIGLVYGSNFSVGVNLMFKIARYSAELFRRFSSYDPFIEEAHHKFKQDAPSGTAFFLKRIVDEAYSQATPTASTRAGYMPGSHTLGFDSEVDTLTISHIARNREGFAQGALLAAQWIEHRKGFHEFSSIIDQIEK